jgi:hypothetical protein
MASDEGIEAAGLKAETAEPDLQWQGESDADNPYGRDTGVFMIFMLIVLKLQLVDQDQMDGDFDSLLCVSEAPSSAVDCANDYTISPKVSRASSFC